MTTKMLAPKGLLMSLVRCTHGFVSGYRWLAFCTRGGGLVALALLSLSACSLSDLVGVDATSNLITPDQVSTEVGAMGLYGGAIQLLNVVYGGADGDVVVSGILSDEFQDSSSRYGLDTRNLRVGGLDNLYRKLQYVRTQGLQAIAAMRAFPEKIPSALIGRVYATVGYAELLLAERYCSGVPLSTIPPGGGTITYSPGMATPQLFERAIAHFDTAIALTETDSIRFRRLARVGKARALMNIGRYSEASEVVSDVPTDFVYYAEFSAADTNAVRPQTGGKVFTSNIGEGLNGIDWFAARDPRVPMKDTVKGTVRTSKYRTATSPIAIADGIEARLIDAEAYLSDNDPRWLMTVNQLRARLVDGAGHRLLADTTDPGTQEARVDLLFYERALWLYATGHRHGDMRRLVRQYRRFPESVFPIGIYVPTPRINSYPEYGSTMSLPLPTYENTNPYVKGCLDTNA